MPVPNSPDRENVLQKVSGHPKAKLEWLHTCGSRVMILSSTPGCVRSTGGPSLLETAPSVIPSSLSLVPSLSLPLSLHFVCACAFTGFMDSGWRLRLRQFFIIISQIGAINLIYNAPLRNSVQHFC